MRYVLASASPRRKELLQKLGFPFEVLPSDCEEKITKDRPIEVVKELSLQKAKSVYEKLLLENPDQELTVIGSDTIVVYGEEILGKPLDKEDAFGMLSMLADRTHQVYTGVSILAKKEGKMLSKNFAEKTDVSFYPIYKGDLIRYIDSGDAMDKAGSYGIQSDFAIHIKKINGDYYNVVGLPVGRLYQELLALKLLK